MASDLTNLNSSRLSALWPVLPTGPQTLLLQACLGSPDVIVRSWNRWSQGRCDPRRFIRSDTWGIKSILPLLHDSLRRADVKLDKDMQTLLRTAFFRERLRLATIHRIYRGLLQTLATNDISSVLAGDLAIAESAYPSPSLRHCGSLHLLIAEEDIPTAIDCLCSQDCKSKSKFKLIRRAPQPKDVYALFVAESGLRLQITSFVRHIPHSCDTFADVCSRAAQRLIDGSTIYIPCPADLLLIAIDHALIHGSWHSIDWLCDACMLVRRFDRNDWDTLLDVATRNHLTFTTSAVLIYLKDFFQCPIPQSVLNDLRLACNKNLKACKDVVTFCARSAARSDLIQALRYAPNIRRFCWVIAQTIRMPLGKIRRALTN